MATLLGHQNRHPGSAGSQGALGTAGLAPTICRPPVIGQSFLDTRHANLHVRPNQMLRYLHNDTKVDKTCNLPQISTSRQQSASSRDSSASYQGRPGVNLPKFSLTRGPCTSAVRKVDVPVRTSTESTLAKTALLLETVNINDDLAETATEDTVEDESPDHDDVKIPDKTVELDLNTNEDCIDDIEEIKAEDSFEDVLTDPTVQFAPSLDATAKPISRLRPKSSKFRISKRNGRKSRARSARSRRKSAKKKPTIKPTKIVENEEAGTSTDQEGKKFESIVGSVPTLSKPPQLRKPTPPKKNNLFHVQSIRQATLIYGQHLPRVAKTASLHSFTGERHNSAAFVLRSTPSAVSTPWKLNDEKIHVTRVYLSERQSGVIKECGGSYPCAPPATPTLELCAKYEYVPCMNDVRSQREVKARLNDMQLIERKKKEKRKEEARRIEIQRQKDSITEQKQRQRQEIYALNKLMTELENENFRNFCQMQLNHDKSG
ncbi:uncharacterized protein [Ptychodera flava]|uniref:uncharacterized protein n=1 Tax=Ptychodera flava TaxID=63121 RepID=UPI003969DF0D